MQMSFVRKLKRNGHTYLVEVKSYRNEKGQVRQKYLRYVGKEVDNKKVLTGSIADAIVTKVNIHAPLLALHEIAQEIGLAKILGEYAPEMLSVVYAHCIQPSSLKKITDWYQRTDLNHLLSLQNLTEKRLLDVMDYYDEDRIKGLQHAIFNRLKDVYHIKCNGIFYDITDVYFYGKECCLAVKGHNSEGLHVPQIQIGLAVTSEEAFPIFHKTYPGNISDSKTASDVALSCREYGIKKFTICWDRGVSSAANISEIEKLGGDVICGIPLNEKIKRIVDGHRDIDSIKNRVGLTKTALYAISQPYQLGTTKGVLIICHNLRMKELLRDERHKRIIEARKMRASEGVSIPSSLKKYFRKNGLNEEKIREAEKYDGISAIFSTKAASTSDVITVYFSKDKVEKAFRTLKGITGVGPIRHWLERRVRGHICICYLSYLLLSILDYKLKQANAGISFAEALDKLNTAYKVYLKDPKSNNTFEKTVLYTDEQETILKAINPALLKM